MILLLSLILITTIWCLGLTIVTQEGMLLYSWRELANEKHESGNKFMEPIILCYYCMPSIHSIIGYLLAAGIGVISSFEWKLIFMYPLVIMGSSLLNGLLWGVHKMIEAKIGYYINSETLSHFDIVDRKKKHNSEKHKTNHN